MSRVFRLGLCAAVLATSAVAAPAFAAEPAAGNATALACANRYNRAMKMEKTMEAMMRNLMPVMMAQYDRPGVDLEGLKAALIEATTESAVAMTPKMMDALAPVMASTFTEAEICGLADFYESDVGRGVVDKMPVYTQAAAAPMAAFVPQMQADMVRRLCAKIDCNAGAATKKPARGSS